MIHPPWVYYPADFSAGLVHTRRLGRLVLQSLSVGVIGAAGSGQFCTRHQEPLVYPGCTPGYNSLALSASLKLRDQIMLSTQDLKDHDAQMAVRAIIVN